ncbi:MAG: carbohydrate ABC transporter permease, partial [Pseudomonadota bacterium]
MSFKSPVDAFSANPLSVIFGPATRDDGKGLSLIDMVLGLIVITWLVRFAFTRLPELVRQFSPPGIIVIGWLIGALGFALMFIISIFGILPVILDALNSIAGPLGRPIIGATAEHYVAVWVENQFYRNFINSLIVTAGVVTVSLTVGTLAGYALARSGSNLAFWLLIAALVFRALPHSVLVAGYLPVFITSS